MSIINFDPAIYVHRSRENNPFINEPFYARLSGYNQETRSFIFDFTKSPCVIEGDFITGKKELIYVLNAKDFHLIGDYKDNLLGVLLVIKAAGGLHKVENIPSSVTPELFKEEIAENAKKMVEFMRVLLQIDSGERPVETAPIEQDEDDVNTDPEEGNLMPNLRGQFYIKDEDGELGGMADELLIGVNSRPNWANIRILKEGGFDVFATESDSFGWLGAAIRTNKGLIFFG